MSLMRNAIGVLLAGGQGERLWPLTRDRAKPAVPFGGMYRIIDMTRTVPNVCSDLLCSLWVSTREGVAIKS